MKHISGNETASKVYNSYKQLFGEAPLVVRSPGRINLIGEHTDYNDGFVLPAAVDKALYIAGNKSKSSNNHFVALDVNDELIADAALLQKIPGHWSLYLNGVIDQLRKAGYTIPAFNCVFAGDLPQGAGMSSSAALECGLVVLLSKLFKLDIDKMQAALIAQKAEHEFAGVKCGIMDQFANMFGSANEVIQLDCCNMEYNYRPFHFEEVAIVLFDTGVKHSLASSQYNIRRQECEAGLNIIQQKYPQANSWRAVDKNMVDECLAAGDENIYKRCRYVVAEIQRVPDACKDLDNKDLKAFGKKMFETHRGLSEDYQVSCAELDFLVNEVNENPSVYGARMMGGGFGGCTINLIEKSAIESVSQKLAEAYLAKFGITLASYIVSIENGTELMDTNF